MPLVVSKDQSYLSPCKIARHGNVLGLLLCQDSPQQSHLLGPK
nr:MAG TPA: hypothetical protein [Caudoviricetes sp.]